MKLKKLFSLAISTVVAVAAFSSVTAFATPTDTPEVAVEINGSYDFTTSSKTLFSSGSDEGTKVTSSDKRFIVDAKVNSNGILVVTGRGFVFKTPANSSCKVTVNETRNNNNKGYKITYNGEVETVTNGGEHTTNEIPANTLVTVEGISTTQAYVKSINVKTAAVPKNYYKLSGTVKVDGAPKAGVSVKLVGSDYVNTDNPTTTDASGKYSFGNIGDTETVDVVIDETDTYFGGKIEKISMADGDVENQDFELEGIEQAQTIKDKVFFDANSLTKDKTYGNKKVLAGAFTIITDSGHPYTATETNDDSYNIGNYTSELSLNLGGKSNFSSNQRVLKFETEGPALIQIVAYANGGNDGERKCEIRNDEKIIESKGLNKNKATTFTYALDSADVYYITADNNISIETINIVVGATLTPVASATSAAAYVNGTNAYTLSAVASGNIESAENITVKSDKDTIATDTTVYETACVDGFVFTAADAVTGSAATDYIYGTQLTGADSDATTNITTRVTTEVK